MGYSKIKEAQISEITNKRKDYLIEDLSIK